MKKQNHDHASVLPRGRLPADGGSDACMCYRPPVPEVGVFSANDTEEPRDVTPPTDLLHPTPTLPPDIDENEAEQICLFYIEQSPAYKLCKKYTRQSLAFILYSCVLDIKVLTM